MSEITYEEIREFADYDPYAALSLALGAWEADGDGEPAMAIAECQAKIIEDYEEEAT